MSTRKRRVEDAKNGKEESTPKRRTPDVSVSQPDSGIRHHKPNQNQINKCVVLPLNLFAASGKPSSLIF
jgi:hypothetical protein